MDIVSKVPFTLQFIRRFPREQIQQAEKFSLSEEVIWKNEIITLSIEENDDIEVLFSSDDINAKLYLDALDIIPANTQVNIDDEGRIYRQSANTPFVLYKSGANYDALRVDVFGIQVECEGVNYYGALEVRPKPMEIAEWTMMRDDLEREIAGLAQDIVRRNIGLGKKEKGYMPPKNLYDFLIIKKYAKSVLAAITDITEKPRNRIQTQYENILATKTRNFDKETIKRYVRMGGSEATYKVPIKNIDFDIQDNRILKMIIIDYEQRLGEFIRWIEEAERHRIQNIYLESIQYNELWEQGVGKFRKIAYKLRKLTGILKGQEWYRSVSTISTTYIPHSFVVDSRYNILYQMYLELKRPQFRISLDPQFSYTWKRSSYLYEMWSYIKLCRILLEEYEIEQPDWERVFSEQMLFPFLARGTHVTFSDDNVYLKVIFDKVVSDRASSSSKDEPIYIVRNHENKQTHNRPDIMINIYSKKYDWYLGSIVLECKYRKLYAFWSEESERSSIEQFQTYYNNARSEYTYGKYGKLLGIHPVKEVIVLTPDLLGNNKKKDDFHILVKSFKPSKEPKLIDDLLKEIQALIKQSIDGCEALNSPS